MKKVLLVEPGYKNKYPPMGLMKISTYHKSVGDSVTFVKGIDSNLKNSRWDRIYITTLFTFDFDVSIKTINYYKHLVKNIKNMYVGGIMASLMPEKLGFATGLNDKNIVIGLLTNAQRIGDKNPVNIDALPLDYDILKQIEYEYPSGDNYMGYTTRGCPNHCPFCAVPILEPKFIVTNNIVDQIRAVDSKFGPKRNLLLLDNNILNTPDLKSLVDDLCAIGFERNSKFIDPGPYSIAMMRYNRGERDAFLDNELKQYLNALKSKIKNDSDLEKYKLLISNSEGAKDYARYMIEHDSDLRPIIEKYRSKMPKSRYLDFNQGIDGRRINDTNIKQLSRLSIKPLRIAFDDIKMKDTYINAIRTAHNHGIDSISNYILYNYTDRPADLYERLKINIELNRELGIRIFSFPMKYSPITRTDRNYVGDYWNRKYILAISAILHVTHGAVAAGSDFFYRAFGKNVDEYFEILSMPRQFIQYRSYFEHQGITNEWRAHFNKLSAHQKMKLIQFVSHKPSEIKLINCPEFLQDIIPYYLIKYTDYLTNHV